MKTSAKVLIITFTALKIVILASVALNISPLVITQFVILPLLLLEAIGVAGYLIEFGDRAPCHRERFENIQPLSHARSISAQIEGSNEAYVAKRIA